MDHQRLFDNVIDCHSRVQGSEGILKDELHLPPKLLQILAFEREDIDQSPVIVENDLTEALRTNTRVIYCRKRANTPR